MDKPVLTLHHSD